MKEVYKIVLSISRHGISYEYLRIGGGDALQLQPMARRSWPEPLAFFCMSDGNIIIGKEALCAVRNGTNNAFGDYFENLGRNLTYSICGIEKPLNYLLLDASELLFRDFFSSVLFNSLGPLDNNRSNMPLIIVCESDVDDNEKAYIKDLFQNGGYAKLAVTQYDQFVEEYVRDILSKQYICNYVLSVLCDGDDMMLTIIDAINKTPRKKERLPKLGIDPRVDFVSNQLWEAVCFQNPFLNKDREWQVLQETAKDFLNSGETQCHSRIRLSDGCQYSYDLTRNSFNVAFDRDKDICRAVDSFLAQNGIRDKNSVLLLLRGNAADNDYFNAILRRGFDHNMVRQSDSMFIDEISRRIIAFDPPRDNPPKHPIPDEVRSLDLEWCTVSAEVKGKVATKRYDDALVVLRNLLEKCRAAEYISLVEGIERKIEEVLHEQGEPQGKNNPDNTPIGGIKDPKESTPPKHPISDAIKLLDREWRTVRADVKGKVATKRYDDALVVLRNLLEKCRAVEYISLIEEIERKIEEVLHEQGEPQGKNKPDNAPIGGIKDLKEGAPPKHPTPDEINLLKREWRTVRAEANAKIRTSRYSEAHSDLEHFLNKCKKIGAKELMAEIDAFIANNLNNKVSSKPTMPSSGIVKTFASPTMLVDELETLINNNKLVEARDLCKKRGDNAKVGILSKIIKLSKSINMRAKKLDDYRKLKNASQIESIIREIDEYIELCDSINVPCTDEKKLRKDYKNIK